MAPALNKLITFLLVISSMLAMSQSDNDSKNIHGSADYKDPEQFEKFRKKKSIIAAWQINQLKEGALVVRLKTSRKLIDALRTQGKIELALEKEKEQFAININTYHAYKDYLTFCKVYFIFSNSSDSLLNGTRTGIFLDSNLNIDPSITMTEKFYLLAEHDYGYNSSIGFVKEDSARKVVEVGNPVREMAVVIKNKYGHQLKGPFPYCVKEKNSNLTSYTMPINVTPLPAGGTALFFMCNPTFLADLAAKDKGEKIVPKTYGNSTVKIKKQYTYEKISQSVDQINDELKQFHRSNPAPDLNRLDPSIKEFLY
ncbi:MAG: hypothetical protein JWO32_1045 [Bacteroidetes bacterium]|nr:hypothetical protein [Bacteroidota bacterium]